MKEVQSSHEIFGHKNKSTFLPYIYLVNNLQCLLKNMKGYPFKKKKNNIYQRDPFSSMDVCFSDLTNENIFSGCCQFAQTKRVHEKFCPNYQAVYIFFKQVLLLLSEQGPCCHFVQRFLQQKGRGSEKLFLMKHLEVFIMCLPK